MYHRDGEIDTLLDYKYGYMNQQYYCHEIPNLFQNTQHPQKYGKPHPATTLSVDSATDLSSLTIGNQHFMTGV